MTFRELREQIIEVGIGLYAIHFTCSNQAGEPGPVSPTLIVAGKECIAPVHGRTADGIFHEVGVDVDTAIFEEQPEGWCQTNSNQSLKFARERVSSNKEIPPFAKGGIPAGFEVSPGVKMPFEIEVVVYGGMGGGELLKTSHSPEARHRPLASAKWKVSVFDAVIQVPARLLTIGVADLLHGSAIGSQLVSDDDFRGSIPLHRFPEEFQGCSLVPGLCDISLQNLTLMIDGAPKIVGLAPDFDEDLIQMPAPLPYLAHGFGSPLADRPGEVGTEPIDPEAHTFVANIDPALVKQVLDIPQRKRKSNVQHHCELDDLG